MKTKSIFIVLFLLIVNLLLNSCTGDGKKSIQVGDAIPSFSSTDLAGKPFSLASHKNKAVIIRFFLLNCPNCKADTLVFNKFYEKYRPTGLEIVYINNNASKPEEVEAFAEEFSINFPVLYDPAGKIAKQYKVKVQPLTLVLSPEHRLLAALLGGVSEAKLNDLLQPYFQK